jgi:hypothetical protein
LPLRSPAISIGQRRARLDALVDGVEHGFERLIGDALPQDVERLDERHAGFQQGRELLIEDQKLRPADPAASSRRETGRRQPAAALQRQDVEALLLQLPAQAVFALGNVDPFQDFSPGGAEPASKFHRISVA